MKNKKMYIGIILLLVIILFTLIYKVSFLSLIKLKGETISLLDNETMFKSGNVVNVQMKFLSGQTNASTSTENKIIIYIKRSNSLTITPTDENVVSVSNSTKPIYIWYENGTIFWYTDATTIYLNENSGHLFQNLKSLKSIEGLNNFNTSKVKNMNYMFSGCSELSTFDTSNFNTSNVISMQSMFAGCNSLETLNISSFNTNNVTNMESMFNGCGSITTLNLSSFNTSKVTNMQSMFYNCKLLISLDISSFDTNNVTNMESMFNGCESITTLNLSSFNTSNVTNMSYMFNNCKSLVTIELSSFNTNNVTSMNYMFSGCESITTLNLSSFNTSNVTSMSYMFSRCKSITTLELSSFNTSNVTNMGSMFSGCESITTLNLSSFNTSNVTNMGFMFKGCESITTLNLSSFNTSNVTNMESMFRGCKLLTTLELISFNTSNVRYMNYMFSGCESITTLELSSFNTSNVTDMSYMFEECPNLVTIYVSSMFVIDSVIQSDDMFFGSYSITGENGTRNIYERDSFDKKYAVIDNESTPGYFSVHKLYLKYDINNGQLAPKHGKKVSLKGSLITIDEEDIIDSVMYNEKIDLSNYNDVNKINIIRQGYHINETKEWIYNNVVYNQNKEYGYSDFCELSSSDCEITLYANWEPNLLSIKYNMNGGVLAEEHGSTISNNNDGFILVNQKEIFDKVKYGETIDLSDYNKKNSINIIKNGYKVKEGEEWNTKADGSGISFNQNFEYNPETLDNEILNKDSTLILYVNWEKDASGSISVKESNYARIDDNMIYIKTPKNVIRNTKNAMLSYFTIVGTYHVYNKSDVEITNDDSLVETGSKIVLADNSEYRIIVYGDVNKDGVMDMTDISMTYMKTRNKLNLDSIQTKAANYNNDSNIDMTDISMIYRHTKGKD